MIQEREGFLSVDPISKSYPMLTPYQFASNTPIAAIDIDGEEVGILNNGNITGTSMSNYFDNSKGRKQWVKWYGDRSCSRWVSCNGRISYKGFTNEDIFNVQGFGTLYHNKAKTLEQANERGKEMIDAGVEIGTVWGIGKIIGGVTKIVKPSREIKIDLMGGPQTKYKDYINYDREAVSGIKDDVANFSKHFEENTVTEIITNNPQAPFLNEVKDALVDEGLITIRGQMNNKFFKEIWDGKAKGMEAYEVVPGSKKTRLSTKGYKRSDGSPLQGDATSLNEIVLKKKKI